MTEQDHLRRALRAAEPTDWAPLDVPAAIAAGRALRHRGRTRTAVFAVACATVVLSIAVGTHTLTSRPGPTYRAPAADARATATATPTGTPPTHAAPVGRVVRTGLPLPDGTERVFCFVPVDVPGEPGVVLGVAAGRRDRAGAVTVEYVVHDADGKDRSPGFHVVGADVPGSGIPTFGYHVGPMVTVAGRFGTRWVRASTDVWNKNPPIVVFWFDQVPSGERPDELSAK